MLINLTHDYELGRKRNCVSVRVLFTLPDHGVTILEKVLVIMIIVAAFNCRKVCIT